MTKEQIAQLAQILKHGQVHQLTYGEVVRGRSVTKIRVCYTVGNCYIVETINESGHVSDRIMMEAN